MPRQLPTVPAARRMKRTRYRAFVISENDKMRVGEFGAIQDAATERLTVVVARPPECGEQVQINCENQLQRFSKRIEGTVAEVTEREDDGLFEVTFTPRLRLSPVEVRALRPSRNDWA